MSVSVPNRQQIVDTDIDCGHRFCGPRFRDFYGWQCCGLEPPWQVRKIDECPLGGYKNYFRKTDSIWSFFHIQNLLSYNTNCCTFSPSPESFWDQQGMGQCPSQVPPPALLSAGVWDIRGGRKNWLGFSRRDLQKDNLIWPTDVQHTYVTVRLPSPDIPFRSTLCGFAEGCRGARMAPGNISKGIALYCRPSPKRSKRLKRQLYDHPNGVGIGCLGHLPPYLVMHA